MPRAKAPPARPRTTPGAGTLTAGLLANHPHHDPAAVVEEAVLDRLPATQAEGLGVDRKEGLRLLVVVLGAARDGFQHRPVAGVSEELLRLRRPEELQEGFCLRVLEPTLGERDRVLDQDRLLRE